MSSSFGRIAGSVLSPIVAHVDVDEIVQRIDVDDIAKRIDIEKHIVERIDVDKLLDRIDINRLLDRVDINRLLEKVDVNEIIERAEIGAIVARSTSGVFSPLVDGFRAQFVILDQVFQGHGICRKAGLPPAPGWVEQELIKMPQGVSNIAVAVQRRYAGTVSRAVAYLIDQIFISMTTALVTWLVVFGVDIVFGESFDPNKVYEWTWLLSTLWILYQILYFWLAFVSTGRTIGMAMLGLQVINIEDDLPPGRQKALIRVLTMTVSIMCVVGVLLGFFRNDRRELHDLISGTGVVYSWDARLAKYREEKISNAGGVYHDELEDIDNFFSTRGSNNVRYDQLFHRKSKKNMSHKS